MTADGIRQLRARSARGLFYISGEKPGRAPATAQHVTVLFHPSEGGTRLELRHEGWASLGPHAEAVKKQYAAGWEEILARFAAHANHCHP